MIIIQRKWKRSRINGTSCIRRCFTAIEPEANKNHFQNLGTVHCPVAKITISIYTFGKMRSAFVTPSRARCTLGTSVAAPTPFDATLLYELTSNVLQRKLFNCIKITTNNILAILIAVCEAISRCFYCCLTVLFTNFYRIFLSFSAPNERQINNSFRFGVRSRLHHGAVLLWQILWTFVCWWCWRMICGRWNDFRDNTNRNCRSPPIPCTTYTHTRPFAASIMKKMGRIEHDLCHRKYSRFAVNRSMYSKIWPQSLIGRRRLVCTHAAYRLTCLRSFQWHNKSYKRISISTGLLLAETSIDTTTSAPSQLHIQLRRAINTIQLYYWINKRDDNERTQNENLKILKWWDRRSEITVLIGKQATVCSALNSEHHVQRFQRDPYHESSTPSIRFRF